MDIILHHCISELHKSLNLPVTQEIHFSIHFKPDIHPKTPFKSPVFRTDYFYFGFIKDGSGSYTIDDNKFSFNSNTIYFNNPGHIKSYALDALKDAYMITLTENFLRENVHPTIFEEFPFLLAEVVPPKVLLDKHFEEFETIYKQIGTEFNKNSIYKNKILGSLFLVLLLKLKEAFWSDYNPIVEGNRNSQIVKTFKQLLELEFKKITDKQQGDLNIQAQHFAEKMHLHPNYLNSVIKSKTGRTVNEWISRRTLEASKILLMNTSYSNKEISYKLGFSEPTHFSRFFRKQTQLSPSKFRASNTSKPYLQNEASHL